MKFDRAVLWVSVAINGGVLAWDLYSGQWTLASVLTLIVVVQLLALQLLPTFTATLIARRDKALADCELSQRMLAYVRRAEQSGETLNVDIVGGELGTPAKQTH